MVIFLKPKGVHGQKSLGNTDVRDVCDRVGKQSSTLCLEVNVVGCVNLNTLYAMNFWSLIMYFILVVSVL